MHAIFMAHTPEIFPKLPTSAWNFSFVGRHPYRVMDMVDLTLHGFIGTSISAPAAIDCEARRTADLCQCTELGIYSIIYVMRTISITYHQLLTRMASPKAIGKSLYPACGSRDQKHAERCYLGL